MSVHKWQFVPRFRRNAFGWRSGTPVQRIKEAIAEIKQVARTEPVLAAEGAISLLEKLSPALVHVDSSSGALGSAVDKAITILVPIIAKADVKPQLRQRWLERLWQALQDDDMPYLELLGDYWGELCVTPALASDWADAFLPHRRAGLDHRAARVQILQGHQCLPGHPCLRRAAIQEVAGVARQGAASRGGTTGAGG
jgi:hypothetical protein